MYRRSGWRVAIPARHGSRHRGADHALPWSARTTARIQFAEDYLRGTATDVALRSRARSSTARIRSRTSCRLYRDGGPRRRTRRAEDGAQPHFWCTRVDHAEGARLLGAQKSLDPSKLLSISVAAGLHSARVIKNVRFRQSSRRSRDGPPNEVRRTWKDIDLQNTPHDARC
jgi:hypothetical protein